MSSFSTTSSEHSPDLQTLPLPTMAEGLPVLGNSIDFLFDTTGFLDKMYRKHGPIFRIQAGWNEFTVIAGFEGKEFLLSGAERYLTREAFFRPVGEQLGRADFVLGVSGKAHERLRRLLAIAYSRQVASPFVPAFLEVVRREVRSWKAGEAQQPLMEKIRFLAFEQYSQVVAGRSLTPFWKDFSRVVATNMNVGGRVLPTWAYLDPLYQRSRHRALGVIREIVLERRKTGILIDTPPTIIDTLLSVVDDEGKPFNDEEVVCYALYGFAGSCAYMSRLVGFLLYELLRHPEHMERLQAEIDRAFLEGLHDATDVRSMGFLRAIYHESMRLHPVSQGLPFLANEEFSFLGKRIRKGDQVVFSQIPMFFSTPPFSEPHEFRPSRCEEAHKEHTKMGAFNPFGMGKRVCTAGGLVEIMSMTMIATLLRERSLSLYPKDYRLRMIVMPLPSPDGRFGITTQPRTNARPSETRLVEAKITAHFPNGDLPEVQAILNASIHQRFPPFASVIRQGEEPDFFYVLLKGRAEVLQAQGGREYRLAILEKGQSFGEIGLLYDQPRNATVRALEEEIEVLAIPRQNFERLVTGFDLIGEEISRLARKRAMSDTLLQAIPDLRPEQLQALLPEFTTESVGAGDVILRQGEPATRFYLLAQGRVRVSAVLQGEEVELAFLGPGAYFGEIGLLMKIPRTATVAASEASVVMSTDQKGFLALLRASGYAQGDLALAISERLLALQTKKLWNDPPTESPVFPA